jgi:hypothetical protein
MPSSITLFNVNPWHFYRNFTQRPITRTQPLNAAPSLHPLRRPSLLYAQHWQSAPTDVLVRAKAVPDWGYFCVARMCDPLPNQLPREGRLYFRVLCGSPQEQHHFRNNYNGLLIYCHRHAVQDVPVIKGSSSVRPWKDSHCLCRYSIQLEIKVGRVAARSFRSIKFGKKVNYCRSYFLCF